MSEHVIVTSGRSFDGVVGFPFRGRSCAREGALARRMLWGGVLTGPANMRLANARAFVTQTGFPPDRSTFHNRAGSQDIYRSTGCGSGAAFFGPLCSP